MIIKASFVIDGKSYKRRVKRNSVLLQRRRALLCKCRRADQYDKKNQNYFSHNKVPLCAGNYPGDGCPETEVSKQLYYFGNVKTAVCQGGLYPDNHYYKISRYKISRLREFDFYDIIIL